MMHMRSEENSVNINELFAFLSIKQLPVLRASERGPCSTRGLCEYLSVLKEKWYIAPRTCARGESYHTEKLVLTEVKHEGNVFNILHG